MWLKKRKVAKYASPNCQSTFLIYVVCTGRRALKWEIHCFELSHILKPENMQLQIESQKQLQIESQKQLRINYFRPRYHQIIFVHLRIFKFSLRMMSTLSYSISYDRVAHFVKSRPLADMSPTSTSKYAPKFKLQSSRIMKNERKHY